MSGSLLHFSSIKVKMVCVVYLITAFVILTVSYLNYIWYSHQMLAQTAEQTQQIIEQAGTNVSTYFNELYRLTLTPYYNEELLTELGRTPANSQEQLNTKRIVEDFLSSVMILPRREILRVYVMNDKGIYTYSRTPYEMSEYNRYQDSDWYKNAQSTTKPIFIYPHFERVYGDKPTTVFSVVRQLRDKSDNSKVLGVIKVDADYTGIKEICEQINLEADGSLLILNEQEQIIYQSAPLEEEADALLSVKTADSDISLSPAGSSRYLINSYQLEDYGIRIIALHSYDRLMLPLKDNLRHTMLFSILCIIIAGVICIVIINCFLKPLFEIIALMKKVEMGDLEVKARVHTRDEMAYLANSFNTMTSNLKLVMDKNTRLITEVYQAKYLSKEAQYNSLCSQIKPHFLYNTLNTVSLLIKCREYDSAVRSIENLSFYLGGIVNVDREITLEHELQICSAYLDIIHFRYKDRLTYKIDIEPKLLAQVIPALTLQPLVENAVKYACEPRRDTTHINLYSKSLENTYTIIVRDNGNGIPSEVLAGLREEMENTSGSHDSLMLSGSGIGLINIYHRLKLKFEEKVHFEIISSDFGTEISITLPMKQGEALYV